jgi:hypothetical protein
VSIVLLLLFTGIGMATAMFEILFKRASTDYFRDNAIAVDILGNVYCQYFFNAVLIKKSSKNKFGVQSMTISENLGRNKREGTLSGVGLFLANTLDWIDPNHCINSIEE